MLTCTRGYRNQTKFPMHRVWWLREAAQFGQTFVPICEKVVQNSAAEFQSILTSFRSKKKTKDADAQV